MKTALLITTYNQPRALIRVLETVGKQLIAPTEVIVCDDGSDKETSISLKALNIGVPVRHIWQPDEGFRAGRSRNLGIAKTDAEYLILIDGDCLLPPNFVESHQRLAKHRHLVAGGRHLLSEKQTNQYLARETPSNMVFSHWKFKSFPMGLLRTVSNSDWRKVRSCNIGLFKNDLLTVGGFDESFVGWGREDSDLVVRLLHSGVKIRSGRLATCVAHLYHPNNDRDRLSANESLLHYSVSNEDHIASRRSGISNL